MKNGDRKMEGSSVHGKLMKLLDSSGVSVLIAAGENGRIIDANHSALTFLGTDREKLSGLPAEEVLQEKLRSGLSMDRELVEENGVVYQVFSFRSGLAGEVESDEDLKRIIQDLDDVYFKTTVGGTIVSVSPSVEKFSGYTPEEVLGTEMKGYYRNPDDRQKLIEGLGRTGVLRDYELVMVAKDGHDIYARGSIHVVRGEDGKPAFLEGLLTDISARKKLEKDLKNRGEYYRQVVQSVPDAVVTVDREGIVTGWNSEATYLFDWTEEEAMGKPLDDLIYTSSGKHEIRSADVIAGQVLRGVECTRRGKKPGEKKVFVSVAPITVNGENRGAVGIYTDLADRESILEKLRENEIKFRSITDSAQDAVIIMDDSGCISFFNASAERMFGYHRTETVGRKLHSFLAPEAYREMFDMGFGDFRKTGQGIVIGRVLEMEGLRKDGTVFPVELSVSSFYMNGGWHATGILRDITDRKRTELELIEAREGALNAVRTKSEFLANMSHEIRTPLNAIIGTTDLLWETDVDQRQRNYLRVCRNAGENLLALINDILDISKVEAGRIELENIDFDLVDCVENTCETLALRAHEKQIELNCRILRNTPEWVNGDPSRIRQILINLVGNAIKFTEKGEVTVTVGCSSDGMISFEVKDSGIGIPEGKLESIFMSFTQADTSHTRRYGGTGLGLTISKKLVELMDGTITVESRMGEGSRFEFCLPLPVVDSHGDSSCPADLASIKGRNILVVDDNAVSRMILTEVLEDWSVNVTVANNGETALKTAGSGNFDMILMDCVMPGMNGFETAEAMRQNGLPTDTVIMMLTSDGSGSCTEECRKAGIQRFVVKPVRREDLLRMLCEVLAPDSGKKTVMQEKNEEIPLERRELLVLLAEDSPDNRFLIQKYLEPYPWKISVAENGREAVDLYSSSSEDFDVILMDMQMPVMDGYEATRSIRAMEASSRGRHTPIVALTAHAMKEEIRKCIDAGCDLHISKPVRKKNLVRELNDLLEATSSREGAPEVRVEEVPAETNFTARVPEDLEPLIPGYISNRRGDIVAIRELIKNGDYSEAARLAHSMKGSGGGYGFDRISELGAMMEKAAREENSGTVLSGIEQLELYLNNVRIEYVEEE